MNGNIIQEGGNIEDLHFPKLKKAVTGVNPIVCCVVSIVATSPYLLFAVTFNDIVCTGYVIEAKISSIILSSRGSQAAGRQSQSHHNIIQLSL